MNISEVQSGANIGAIGSDDMSQFSRDMGDLESVMSPATIG